MPTFPENMTSPPGKTTVSALVPAALPRRQTVHWIIAMLLAIIATTLITRRDDMGFLRSAFAQSTGMPRPNLEGGRGIYAFTGQVSRSTYGLFMLDVDTGTVWCYELDRGGPNRDEPTLNLIAARSWVYDRYLEEFNTGDPIPSVVKQKVQQQRSTRPTTTQP
jgi:hypothetical protein